MPRTRRDGPSTAVQITAQPRIAPHTQGWPFDVLSMPGQDVDCPAHAGMARWRSRCRPLRWRLPRTRRDGPTRPNRANSAPKIAPHTQGWPRPLLQGRIHRRDCPAHAGMAPFLVQAARRACRLPRTRRDGPIGVNNSCWNAGIAPHTQGWPGGPYPHENRRDDCPAHAGMARSTTYGIPGAARLPRTRRDGPADQSAQRLAYLIAPHTQGWPAAAPQPRRPRRDCPAPASRSLTGTSIAPHTRGWSHRGEESERGIGACSAPADMVPESGCASTDGIVPPALHMQGWSPLRPRSRHLLHDCLAHARMAPRRARTSRAAVPRRSPGKSPSTRRTDQVDVPGWRPGGLGGREACSCLSREGGRGSAPPARAISALPALVAFLPWRKVPRSE